MIHQLLISASCRYFVAEQRDTGLTYYNDLCCYSWHIFPVIDHQRQADELGVFYYPTWFTPKEVIAALTAELPAWLEVIDGNDTWGGFTADQITQAEADLADADCTASLKAMTAHLYVGSEG
ncbi:hypothetical protein ELG97_37060 [Rhizobium leguminosarum]|uniref:hypothetical protein n=1 Tax=Rhizobium leguminosarum TaxID=384 RepID=UPI0010314C89|nr:hypothetical protein [Rhizobium leguminosarum]TBE73841.1 hypothetical protein ELG97_37060 [Rhizobium leguminosarum]